MKMKKTDNGKINEALTRGVDKIYPSKKALEKVLRSGKKIRLYQGFDPSMPNLHLGHLVGILKLKQFQDLGHEVIFLVGDFTGMIGDPTDKASVRKKLTRKQVQKNCQSWKKQAEKLLIFEGKNPVRWLFNSDWNDKITFKELIEISSHITLQQILERDFFQTRLKKGKPIYLHEFLYPVAQGYDSIAMNVDLEIGGSDQTFNMLVGRNLMKSVKGKEKFVLTTKLLVDAKGEKAGKSTGNALFLNASPADIYGGIMSFPDEVISSAFELLTTVPMQEIHQIQKSLKSRSTNPMTYKKRLAFAIIKLYFGEKKAQRAQEEFEQVFQKGKKPPNPEILRTGKQELGIIDLLIRASLVKSRSEAKRLVRQGGVDVNGKTIRDTQSKIRTKNGMIVRAGKRKFVKIVCQNKETKTPSARRKEGEPIKLKPDDGDYRVEEKSNPVNKQPQL